MKKLFRILTGLENEPGYVDKKFENEPGYAEKKFDNLVELVNEIKKYTGFSIEIINGMRTIRLLDHDLVSIIQNHFREKLSVNSVIPLIRLSDILTELENKSIYSDIYLDYLIEVIKGFSFEEINGMKCIRLLDPNLTSIMQKYFPENVLSVTLIPMKRLFRILPNLENEPGFVKEPYFIGLVSLIKVIRKHIGFSFEKINDERYIRLLDHNLVSIIQRHFHEEYLSVNSVVPIKRLSDILTDLRTEHGFDLNYLIEVIKGFSSERINGITFIGLSDPDLKSILQKYFPGDDLSFFLIPVKRLFYILPNLEKEPDLIKEPRFKSLINLIKEVYEDKIKSSEFSILHGKQIAFEYLPYFYSIGQCVTIQGNQGAKITKMICGSYYDENIKKTKAYNVEEQKIKLDLTICVEVINSDGCSFIRETKEHEIESWEGYRKISELSIIPLSEKDAIYETLVERGKKFKKYAIGHHFLQHFIYKGKKGRVIVDIFSGPYNKPCGKKEVNVKEEELFMCTFKLHAYNIAKRKWYCDVDIELLNEITFDEEAFDKLVLNKTTKELIESLITSKFDTDDIISEKGGGCSLLLHGPPGVGKTLTVEAISERLHRPLFHTNAEELGLTEDGLEENLQNLFDLSYLWDGFILIDEADIYLERRSVHDINRNALVCVFLRLLEYHQGVIFLTTN